MIIDITRPTFAIDLDNRCSYSYNSDDFVMSRIITVEEYPNGFPELKDGEILFRYTNNRGYILKFYTVRSNSIELIEKWSNRGFISYADKRISEPLAICFESADNYLINKQYDKDMGYLIYPIIIRLLRVYDEVTINYDDCIIFTENLIEDYNKFNNEQYPHIESMLTRLIGNDKIDIELEIVTLYCEINNFNKILNKK